MEQSIRSNKREDGLYHAYNLMTVKGDGVQVSYLSEMLEGQVAVLSSKYLSAYACGCFRRIKIERLIPRRSIRLYSLSK